MGLITLLRGWKFGIWVALAVLCAQANGRAVQPVVRSPWVTTWASAQMAPYGTETIPGASLQNATLRERVHLSAGGTRLRLRISNLFGEDALQLRSVHVALPGTDRGSSRIQPETDKTLLFNGASSVSIPAGAEYISDPLPFTAAPLSDVAVTLVLDHSPRTPTLHAGAHATAFLTAGDHAAEAELPTPSTITRWYFLAGMEVAGDRQNAGTVVAFGDSITDGHGSTTDGNNRWPDLLAARLNASGTATHLAVANEGIGGNRILEEGLGTNAMARFSRDGLDPSGAKTLILLEGINDIGTLDRVTEHAPSAHQALVRALEAAMQQLVAQAHDRGIRVLGATLTPFSGSEYYHPSAASEEDRQALNAWIRQAGHFDGVIDFDLALRDPRKPDHLLASADSGDHLHPGPEGYRRMAEAVPLKLLLP